MERNIISWLQNRSGPKCWFFAGIWHEDIRHEANNNKRTPGDFLETSIGKVIWFESEIKHRNPNQFYSGSSTAHVEM